MFLQVAQSEVDTFLILELDRAEERAWLDQVELQAVNGAAALATHAMGVATSTAPMPRSFRLGAVAYTDVHGNVYPAGSVVTLAPYRSMLLFRVC